jgi:outer membrane receptor for ferrienterochelin and colicin
MDSGGASYVPGAKVVLQSSEALETETDADGHYIFHNVAPGAHTITASFPGLQSVQDVTVQGGANSKIDLELKPVAVTTSVTVADTANDDKAPTITETITQKTIADAPNVNDRFESLLPLVPGVVRGPDGRINLKGARNTQSGALVNSANVTDPATGGSAISLPIDVVSSVQVISNPYDPQYGNLTGAVSTAETKTGNYEQRHFSIQNIMPRPRFRDGTLMGIESATPRMTLTGPVVKDKVAITQSFEYRFVRTPVTSLPELERDQTLEGFNSYTQFDFNISAKQTATVSVAVYPQRLEYMGLNTFTPQPSTVDYHQRGTQVYGQHRLLTGTDSALTSQISYKTYDADTTPEGTGPYQLLINTTKGEFFNQQSRRTNRLEWQESYAFAPRHFLGSHRLKAGMDYSYSGFDGRETFLPAELIGSSSLPIERITFTRPTAFSVNQNAAALYVADEWVPFQRVTFTFGLRSDTDSVTGATNASPRAGVMLALTNDGKTLLKAGGGVFYDRVPLMLPVFESYPERKVSYLGANGQVTSSTAYVNRITGNLQNPRSTAWNVELDRQITSSLSVRVGYENRNTARDFIVSPTSAGNSSIIGLSNGGYGSYREFQVTASYHTARFLLNGSYVHSRAYGTLNDPSLFFGNYPQAVIQTNASGRLSFDAPNRFLVWGDIKGPWKLTIMPVWDIHTGFPWSVQNEYREYLGARNTQRYPYYSSTDLQVSRPFTIHFGERQLKTRAGFAVFNLFNHDNPRDVQSIVNSSQFGGFYNDAWRTFRGKFVFEF